ncbi:MAG TPA: caspase family protein, partial [Acidobacteriota bacterium]|nr:caspase family protein [Acidobacteriota bacterium]
MAAGRRFHRRALLIGVAQYPAAAGVPALPPLPGADRNPWLLAPELAARGFACELLLNEHATREEIRRAVRALVMQARTGDVCVLGFSGHGFSLSGSGSSTTETGDFLYPHDAQTAGPIRSDELLRWLLPAESRVSLYCVLDACHADAVGNGLLSRWRLPVWSRPWRGYRADPDGDTVQPDNTLHHVVLSACRDNERADYSSRTCGTFTRALVDVLAL